MGGMPRRSRDFAFEFETLLKVAQNIFFVVFIQKKAMSQIRDIAFFNICKPLITNLMALDSAFYTLTE